MSKIIFKKNIIISFFFLILILLISIFILSTKIETISVWHSIVKIVESAFNIDPTPQLGSNLGVCTDSISWGDMCLTPLQPILSWNITSGTQVSYAVQVDNNGWLPKSPPSSFPSPEVDTGEIPSSSNSYATLSGKLAFNTTYFWQVAVKDNFGSWSGWTEDDASFTTVKHIWPLVNFSWAPTSPSIDEEVQFADQTTVYGGASKSSWLWTIPDATYINGTNNTFQNPIVKFTSEGNKQVLLRVTDSDSYVCSATKTIGSQVALPEWEEK